MLRRAALLATLLLTTACSSDAADTAAGDSAASSSPSPAAGAPAAGGGDDLADVAAYELTMEKVDRYFAAQRNVALRLQDLTPAERDALGESEGTDESLDEMARKIDGNPTLAAAVREAGLSGREFATISIAILQSAMAASVLQTRPNDDQDSLVRAMQANPANVRFMKEHEAELTRKQAALQAELQRLGTSRDG